MFSWVAADLQEYFAQVLLYLVMYTEVEKGVRGRIVLFSQALSLNSLSESKPTVEHQGYRMSFRIFLRGRNTPSFLESIVHYNHFQREANEKSCIVCFCCVAGAGDINIPPAQRPCGAAGQDVAA